MCLIGIEKDLLSWSSVNMAAAGKKTLNQLVHTLSYGDAISSEAITIKALLREKGWESEIYCLHVHPKLKTDCKLIDSFQPEQGGDLLLHYSLGSPLNEIFEKYDGGGRYLMYHNLTPHEWFEGYNRRVYDNLIDGAEELPRVGGVADLLIGVSDYNCKDLEERGLPGARKLPIPFDHNKWGIEANSGIKRALDGHGGENLLTVGRIAPNKCLHDILKTFYFYHHKISKKSKLWIVGHDSDCEIYSLELRRMVSEFNLKGAVEFVGAVSDCELKAFYQNSDAYLCMSEHEGFCVPLIEAMYFNLPVVAYDSSAISETLGPAGLLVQDKSPELVAELINEVLSNQDLRKSCLESGASQLERFSLESFSKAFFEILSASSQEQSTSRDRAVHQA